MTKIVKLRLRNFKSFRKADIPFSKGFTAIVGANASGKTNILDALLFVFGITSLKTLRAARLTDLVNHDADEGYAKVEVEIGHADKSYVISRTIDKQGRSAIRLDGRKKGLNEITALLNEIGIEATGHNIVTQGDVTRVVEMNPKQRREIIDDIAGLSEFEEKKEEAMKKLEKVDERIRGVGLVLAEREAYLQQLEKEREAALRYQSLQDELKRIKATILHRQAAKMREDVALAKKKIESLATEETSARHERDRLLAEISATEKKLEEIMQRMLESSQRTYSTIGREVESCRAELRIASERLGRAKADIAAGKERIISMDSKMRELLARKKEKDEALEKNKTMLREVEGELKKLEKGEGERLERMKTLAEEAKAFEKGIARLGEEIARTGKKVHDARVKEAEAKKEKGILEKQAKEILEKRRALGIEGDIAAGLKDVLAELADALGKARKTALALAKEEGMSKYAERLSAGVEAAEQVRSKIAAVLTKLGKVIDETIGASKESELAERLSELGGLLDEAEKESAGLAKELSGLADEKAAAERKLAAAREKSTGFAEHESLMRLRNRKADLQGLVAALGAETAGIEKRIDETREERAEAEKAASLAAKDAERLSAEEASLEDGLGQRERELEKASKESAILEEEKQRLSTKLKNISDKKESADRRLEMIGKESNAFSIELTKSEVRLSDIEQEIKAYDGIEPIGETGLQQLERRSAEAEKEISGLGAINMRSIEGFEEYKKEVEDVKQKVEKLEQEGQAVLEMIDKIELKKTNVFFECFNQINSNFKQMYYSFFGGEGRLSLTDETAPLEAGLIIEAKYKEGIMKSIDALSGGEKSLTALAFLFAIQSYEPAPFYIFDEADAALDMENSLKLARLIKDISSGSQFIAITHNDSVVKEADQLIGVALSKQKSSVIGLRLRSKLPEGIAEAIGNRKEAQGDAEAAEE